MNNQNQSNKPGNEGAPKPGQQKADKHLHKEPVARSVKGQHGSTGQVTRKAHVNVTPIDQGNDRE